MTSATPKPRAGERVPVTPFRWDNYDSVCRDAENWIVGWQGMMDIANALEAERDLLRARERELVEVLEVILRAEFGSGMVVPAGCESTYWGKAHAILAKHGR